MADESIEQNDTQTEPSTVESESTEKMFSQDEVDALIKKRLDKRNREVERKYEGVDPEEYRSIKAAQEAEELERQKERGEFENVMKQTVEKWEIKTNALQDELRKVKVDGALLSAASRGKAINAEQVANLLRANVRMSEDGAVEVVDTNGTARYDEQGSPMTPDALVDEFLSGNPHFVAATPSGTGSQSSIGGGLERKNIMDMSHDEYREWRKSNRNQTKGYIKMA
tara:strand:- start:6832 stop:7509 length:678 start_codon:yes stop_codon:yes gene_type:complete